MSAPNLPQSIRTPAYVLDVVTPQGEPRDGGPLQARLRRQVLLATKSWAMPAAFPLMRGTLDGTTASGEYEARLGREEFGKEVHVYAAPAYGPGGVERPTRAADHIYFNSPEQIALGLPIAKAAGRAVGMRINPGFSNATLGGCAHKPCALTPFSGFHPRDRSPHFYRGAQALFTLFVRPAAGDPARQLRRPDRLSRGGGVYKAYFSARESGR